MQEARSDLLKQMPIFGGIRNDILAFLLDRTAMVRVCRSEFFFREGDAAQSMYVL